MTELFIKPRLSTKEATFKGTVAAGEQVSVKIANPSDALDLAGLRLRVVGHCGETLAQFPEPVEEGETPDSWGEDSGHATCVLDLCTDKMLAAVPPRATVEFLFVLDDAADGVLYFKDLCPITHWPMRTGEDVPKNVRDYRDFIAEAEEAISNAQEATRAALEAAEGYVAEGTGILEQAQVKLNAAESAASSAVEAKNDAESAVEDAQEAKTAAENAASDAQAAQAAAESAKENIETPTTDLTLSGKAADAKTVGDRFAELENSISAKADTSSLNGLATQASVENEATLRDSADAAMSQDISNLSISKADKSETYTKAQVDAIVDAVKNGRFIVVSSLPAAASADKNAIYLVPNALSQANDTKDEYIVVGTSWEKIGNTQIDLSDLANKLDKSGGAIAGNLSVDGSLKKRTNLGLGGPVTLHGPSGDIVLQPIVDNRWSDDVSSPSTAQYLLERQGEGYGNVVWRLKALPSQSFVASSSVVSDMLAEIPLTSAGSQTGWSVSVPSVYSEVATIDIVPHLAEPSTSYAVAGKAADAKATGDALASLLSAICSKQNTLTFDSAPTSGSTNPVTSGGVKTELDGKVSKDGTTDVGVNFKLTNNIGQGNVLYCEGLIWYFLGYAQSLRGTGQTGPDHDIDFLGGKWKIGNIPIATTDDLPYSLATPPSSGTPTANTRQMLKFTATSAQSVTLPTIPDTDEVLNCDIVVNGTAATADFGLTIVGGTGVNVYYPDGEAITCKAGCVTMVSCVGIDGLGWLVVGCNNLKTAS